MLGAPGAGKGTQAANISELNSIPVIGTGGIIRDVISGGSDLGNEMKSFIDKGLLVPDDLVLKMVAKRLAEDDCKNGYILDGFPRTLVQVFEFEKMGGKIDAVFSLVVNDADIVSRISGRRMCERCNATYHLEVKPPKVVGICDICGGMLVIRVDDAPETVFARLRVYHEWTKPLVDYYATHSKYVEIDATKSVDEITAEITSILETI